MGLTLVIDRDERSYLYDGKSVIKIDSAYDVLRSKQPLDAVIISESVLYLPIKEPGISRLPYGFLYGFAVASGYDTVIMDMRFDREVTRGVAEEARRKAERGIVNIRELQANTLKAKVATILEPLQAIKQDLQENPPEARQIRIAATELKEAVRLRQQSNPPGGPQGGPGELPPGKGGPPRGR